MLTIWPLDEPDASEALKDDCDFAVDHYDLAGGILAIQDAFLESQASLDEAFVIWQKRIVENPALWTSGFSVQKIRLALRDFVDHYGTDVVKFWGGKN